LERPKKGVNAIRRLKDLNEYDIFEWRAARMKSNSDYYHPIDHKRYNCVDIAEELLDAKNIMERFYRRLMLQGYSENYPYRFDAIVGEANEIIKLLDNIFEKLQTIDEMLPSEYCTDEEGGDRIWIN